MNEKVRVRLFMKWNRSFISEIISFFLIYIFFKNLRLIFRHSVAPIQKSGASAHHTLKQFINLPPRDLFWYHQLMGFTTNEMEPSEKKVDYRKIGIGIIGG